MYQEMLQVKRKDNEYFKSVYLHVCLFFAHRYFKIQIRHFYIYDFYTLFNHSGELFPDVRLSVNLFICKPFTLCFNFFFKKTIVGLWLNCLLSIFKWWGFIFIQIKGHFFFQKETKIILKYWYFKKIKKNTN